MNLMQGIKDIELIPTLGDSINIVPRLKRLFDDAHSVKAAIAFWTFSFQKLTSILGPCGTGAFQGSGSFLCVDIQEPTNIGALASLDQNNVNIHLNLRRLHPAVKKLTSSTGLLHTKVLVVDKNDGDAEIWVGSHNWTQFALRGPNTEATLAIMCDHLSPLYSEVTYFLNDIKDNLCDPFDETMVDVYKQIQADLAGNGGGETAVVIEVESDDAHLIGIETILVFGTEIEDYESLKRVGGKIIIRIHDSRNGDQFVYHGMIIQTGQMGSYNHNASGLSFNDVRRYAFCTNRRIPKLEPPQGIPVHVMQRSKYFVTLQLERREHRTLSITEYRRARRTNWIDEGSDPIFNRMWVADEKHFSANNYQFSEEPPRIQIPFFKRNKAEAQDLEQTRYLELPLEEKRERNEYRLIRKATIRYD